MLVFIKSVQAKARLTKTKATAKSTASAQRRALRDCGYSLSADQENTHGKNNLQVLSDDLEERGIFGATGRVDKDPGTRYRPALGGHPRSRRVQYPTGSGCREQDDLAVQLEGMATAGMTR
jgi:hypothetical protein